LTSPSPPSPRGARPAPLRRVLIVAGLAAAVVILAVVLWAAVAGVSATLPDVASLERRAPSRTALMRIRAAEARKRGRTASVDQRWVSYERISPRLRRAVLIAEDDAFFSHGGMDWDEMQASMRKNIKARRMVRGGSTITQQLAKNLFLSPERTLTRKLKELLLARRLEEALSKRRIFELYLNLIEWGDGVYGIEAAAQRHFGVSAASLDARQSALLAAVIINPRRFDPAHPNRRIERRARMILSRMWRRGFIAEEEYRLAIGEPAPAPPDTTGGIFGPLFGPAREPAPADSAAAPEPAEVDTSAAPADSTPVPER
jgi:monofunctional biosynthetic peptidoglycan transglycosylase